MEQPPPLPIDYGTPRRPDKPLRWRPTGLLFLMGLICGSIFSGAVWPFTWHYIDSGAGSWLMVAVPAVKLVAAVTCMCFPRWRPLGAGIFISMIVGFMIFFGVCASNFKI